MRPTTVPYSAVAVLFLDNESPDFQTRTPAYYARIDHKPVFVHSLDALAASKRFREIILMVHPNWLRYAVEEVDYWEFRMVHHIYPAKPGNRLANIRTVLSTIHQAYDCICFQDGIVPLTPVDIIREIMDLSLKEGFVSLLPPNKTGLPASNNENTQTQSLPGEVFHYPVAFHLPVLKKLLDHNLGSIDESDLVKASETLEINRFLLNFSEPHPYVHRIEDLEICETLIRKRLENRT